MITEKRKRVCSLCVEAITAIDAPFCQACTMEHERLEELDHINRNDVPVEWWGPTAQNVNGEDYQFGFHVEEAHA